MTKNSPRETSSILSLFRTSERVRLRASHKRNRNYLRRILFEWLESRQLLATVNFLNGIVTATGSDGADIFTATAGSNGQVTMEGQTFSDVDKIVVIAKGGDDTIQFVDNGSTFNQQLRDRSGNLMPLEVTGSGKLTIQNDSTFGNKDLEFRGWILNVGTVELAVPHYLGAFGPFNSFSGNIHLGNDTLISTRSIVSGDPILASSNADSSDIAMKARSVTIDSGSKLLAHVEAGSAFQAGNVTIQAEDKTLTADFSIIGVTKNVASIKIDQTTIYGRNVSISALSKDLTLSDALPKWVTNYVIGSVTDSLLSKIPIPLAVMVRGSESTIEVLGSTIRSSGNVSIDASSTVDASGKAISVAKAGSGKLQTLLNSFTAAYSQASATAKVNVAGTASNPVVIVAAGNIDITSEVKNTAAATARTSTNVGSSEQTPANPKSIGASVAVSKSTTTAHAIVNQFTDISSGANVNVHAVGKTKNSSSADVTVYKDGLGGVGLAVGLDDADIRAEVDGRVTATGLATGKNFTINDVSGSSDTFTLPGHGFNNGDKVVYSSSTGQPIGGLTSGKEYYVRVIDADSIKLLNAEVIDIENDEVSVNSTQTLRRRQTSVFDASLAANVNLTNDTLRLVGHGLTIGDEIFYSPDSDSDARIGGLQNASIYYAIVFDADNIRLANSVTEAQAGTFIDLTALGSGLQILGYEEAAKSFNPVTAVHADSDSVTIPGHGFSDGDTVTYRNDSTNTSTVFGSRTSTFNSASVAAGGDVDLVSNTFRAPAHGLETGQQIVYRADSSTVIGISNSGLLVNGLTYFAIKVNVDTFKIASNRSNASSGIAIDLTSAGTGDSQAFETFYSVTTFEAGRTQPVIDLIDDTIEISSHGLKNNDRVTYESGGSDVVGGLIDGLEYFVTVADANRIALSANVAGPRVDLTSRGSFANGDHGLSVTKTVSFDASSASIVSADAFTVPGHGLTSGDKLNYRVNGGAPIIGMIDGNDYFAIVIDGNTFKLAASYYEATDTADPVAIDITAVGSGQQQLLSLGNSFLAFDPTMLPPVDLASDQITIAGHGFQTGDQVTYLNGGGTSIGGLNDGNNYFVVSVDENTIRLAPSLSDANAGNKIDLTSQGVGLSHGFERRLALEVGDTEIRGLRSGAVYFVTKLDDNTIQFSDTLAAAIDLDTTSGSPSGHSLQSQNGSGIKILADLQATNEVGAGSKIGGDVTFVDKLTKGEHNPVSNAIGSKLSSLFLGSKGADASKGSDSVRKEAKTTANISGSVGYQKLTHNVVAIVGSHAVLKSSTDVTVQATGSQKVAIAVSGKASPDKGGKSFALAAGVGVGIYENTVQAIVDSGSTIDALGTVNVHEHLVYPLLLDDLIAPFQTHFTGTDFSQYADILESIISFAQVSPIFNAFANSQAAAKKPKEGEEPKEDAKLTVTGSVLYTTFTNKSEATIRDGAQINQDVSFRGVNQSVKVDASTVIEQVELAGILKFDVGKPDKIIKAITSWDITEVITPFGNQAKSLGIGGSVLFQDIDNTTIAAVQGRAVIHTGVAGVLDVAAYQKFLTVALAFAGGKSGKVGISGAFDVINHTSRVEAYLGSGIRYDGGKINVTATDDLRHITAAGVVQTAGNVGLGVSGSIVDVDRSTEAYIGKHRDDPTVFPGLTNIQSTGDVTVTAESEGAVWSFSMAGVSVSPVKTKPADASADSVDLKKGTTGFGLSGDISIHTIADNTKAYINDPGTFTVNGSITLEGHDTTTIHAASGSVAKLGTEKSVGIAGSYARNKVTGGVQSAIYDATLNITGALKVSAIAESSISSFAASGQLGGTLGIAGQVTLNNIGRSIEAFLENANVTNVTRVDVIAADDSTIFSISGAATFGSKFGIGASIALNTIDDSVFASLRNSDLNATGELVVTADNSGTDIRAITAAIAAGKEGMQLAGSLSINRIDSDVAAWIQGQKTIFGIFAQNITLIATDGATINADGGGVALAIASSTTGGTDAGTIGVSVAINEVTASALAFIEAATVVAVGAMAITAKTKKARSDTFTIDALSIAGAVSGAASQGFGGALAGAGAGARNVINRTIEAFIKDSGGTKSVEAKGGSITLNAVDESRIRADSGGFGLAGTLGTGSANALSFGVSVSLNEIGTSSGRIAAYIDNSIVTAAGDLTLLANSTSKINALSIGGAVSGSVGGAATSFAGAGAAGINTIQTQIEASIRNSNATTKNSGKVVISATDTSEITSNVVGGSVSAAIGDTGATAIAIGVSISRNEINNSISANIQNSTIIATQSSIRLNAIEVSDIEALSAAASISVAVAGTGGFSLSGAGAEARNIILGTINAFVIDSTLTSNAETALNASNTPKIDAKIVSASLAVGGGTGGDASLAVGAAVAQNFIGFDQHDAKIPVQVQAYIRNSTIVASGAVNVTATADETIEATTVAASMAAVVGTVGLAGAGAGVTTTNKIATHVSALIDGSSSDVSAASVTMKAEDTSKITALSAAAAAAFALSPDGAALAVGVTLSKNVIENTVEAKIKDAKVRTPVTGLGGISVIASSTPTISAQGLAGGLAAGVIAGAGAGVDASGTISGNTTALVDNATISSTGQLLVRSASSAISTVTGGSGAVTIGLGAAVGVTKTQSEIVKTTVAQVGGTIQVGSMTVTATGSDNSKADSTALAGGLLAEGVNFARSQISPNVSATISSGAMIDVSGNAVVQSIGSAVGEANSFGVTVGALSVGISKADITQKPTVHTVIGNDASIVAGGTLHISSDLPTNQATVDTNASGGSLQGISGANSVQSITDDVATTVGDRALIQGDFGLDVTSKAKTKIDTTGRVEIGGGVSSQRANGEHTIQTTARTTVGAGASLIADRGVMNVTSLNTVDVVSNERTRFYGVGSGSIARSVVTLSGLKDAKLAETLLGAGSTLRGFQVNVNATVSPLNIYSNSDGQQFSVGGSVDTTSIVTVNSVASVVQGAGAKINAEKLDITSAHGPLNLQINGDQSKGFGLAPVHTGKLAQFVNLGSETIVQAGAELAANNIVVQALGATGTVNQDKSNSAIGIPIDKVNQTLELATHANVDISGKLLPASNSAELLIDSTGKVLFNRSFAGAGLAVGSLIGGPDAVVNGLKASSNPSLLINAAKSQITTNVAESGTQLSQVTFGSTASKQVPDRFSSVTIDNRSTKNLVIAGIDVMLPSVIVIPSILAESVVGTLADGGVRKLGGVIDIGNQSAANVLLTGAINNPNGVTNIHTTGGSIEDNVQTAATQITTAALILQAPEGHLGSATNPVQAMLNQDANLLPKPSLGATAKTDIAIKLTPTNPVISVQLTGVVSQSGNVSLSLGGNDVVLAGGITTGGNIQIANVGSITDLNNAGADIAGVSLLLTANGSLGETLNPIETSVGSAEIDTTAGASKNIFFNNDRALTIGGVSTTVTGLKAGGEINVVSNASLTIVESIVAGGNVRLTAVDALDPAANSVLLSDPNGNRIESTGGDVALLSGDSFTWKATDRLIAGGTNGQLTIGIDWGNADIGVGANFTVPTQSTAVITAKKLRIVADSDNDVLSIPDLFLPTTFEGAGGFDSVDAILLGSPSAATLLTNIDIEKIKFANVSNQVTQWTLDTDPSTQLVPRFALPDLNVNTSRLSSGISPVVQNMHSLDASFESLDVMINLGEGVDSMTVLSLRHPVALSLGGGNDTVTVGGLRTVGTNTVPIDPGSVQRLLSIQGGTGNDNFVLLEPRTGSNVVPIGRIGATSSGAGLVKDYGSREVENSTKRIEFSSFEQATVNLGETASIFTLFDTVIPTTINAGGRDDVVIIRKLSVPTTVNLQDGNDTLIIQGGGAHLTVDGGTGAESSVGLPDAGDRLLLGSTRAFDETVINVSDARNAIKIFGTGWEPGQQVMFTSDGVAPAGLTSGKLYYVVPFGREIIRLAETRDKALAASSSNENDPNIIKLTSGGIGKHQLTLTIDGQPQWPFTIGSLTGSDANPLLAFSQPRAELAIRVDSTTDRLTTPKNHGFQNGQQVAFFSDGTLPGGLKSEKFYFVTNKDATSFQLSETQGGTTFDITSEGTGNSFVTSVGTAGFTNFEKMNVLLGLGNDTFVVNSTIQNLSVELRGGPGDDEFVLLNVPAKATVIRGDGGANDTVRVLVAGDPRQDQFSGLTIGAGIERLTVDNSDNASPVDWVVSQGTMYFVSGSANTTVDSSNDTFSFSGSEFSASRFGATPLANGDRILVSSIADLPKYQPRVSEGQTSPPRLLDASQFYVARQVTADSFQLSLPGDNTVLDLASTGTGALSFRRISVLVSLEGAETSELRGGGDQVATLSVVTPLDATVDVTGNQLRIIEGARVLDETSNLSRASFSVDRVDGLQGVRSVVTTANHFVFAAGTAEDKLSLFVRDIDPNDATKSLLMFVKALDQSTGNVPVQPSVVKLSPDEHFLYVVGTAKISIYKILSVNGKPDLQWVQAISSSGAGQLNSFTPANPSGTPLIQSINLSLSFMKPTDLEFSRAFDFFGNEIDRGTSLYVTDAGVQGGILRLARDVNTGLITAVDQKLTQENSFAKASNVGDDDFLDFTGDNVSNTETIVLDEPFSNTISGRGVYRFYAFKFGTITPALFRPIAEDDHTLPGSLPWVKVATGTPRTIEHLGFNEFDFGLRAGVAGSGLYFGWHESGDESGLTTVLLSEGTSSNAFVKSNSSNAYTFKAGRAYAIKASFEVQQVKGLDAPQTIAISNDGQKLFTGDSAGNIATWEKQIDGRIRLFTNNAWYYESTQFPVSDFGDIHAVELSIKDDRSTRVATTSQFASIVSAGDTLYAVHPGNSAILSSIDDGVTWSQVAVLPTKAEGTSVGVPVPVVFDIDAGAVALATNGTYLLVGTPASEVHKDFYDQPTTTLNPDKSQSVGTDSGAVLAYKIDPIFNELTLVQVFRSTGYSYGHFGSFIAMDGNQAVIRNRRDIEIWEFNTLVPDRWERQFVLTDAAPTDGETSATSGIVDIDRNTLITKFNNTTKIYQKIGTTWTEKAEFAIDPIAVTIDGSTASVTDNSGFLHIFRQDVLGSWIAVQSINTGATLSRVDAIANNSSPSLTRVRVTGFKVTNKSEVSGEDLYVNLTGTDETHLYYFGDDTDERRNITDFPLQTITGGSPLNLYFRESDSGPDDDFGLIQFSASPTLDPNGFILQYQTNIGGITNHNFAQNAVYMATRDESFSRRITTFRASIRNDEAQLFGNFSTNAIDVDVEVIVDREDDRLSVVTDIADSLGDAIAIGLTTGRTSIYAESDRQAGWYSAGAGMISDIAVSPDGTTIYATQANNPGSVYVLGLRPSVDPALFFDTLRLNPLQVLTTPTVTNLVDASSVALSPDGQSLYVTAATSGAVTVFERISNFGQPDVNNTLGKKTLIDNSGNNFDGVADSATEAFFMVQGNSQRFLVTASASASTLATFQILNSTTFVPDQGSNPNGRNGLGDGDPLNSVTRVQALTINPTTSSVTGVQQVFYAAAPEDDTIFVLNRDTVGKTTVVQRLRDDKSGSSGQDDKSLAGAADIQASPDGRFIYVAATKESQTGEISVYERVILTDDLGADYDGLKFNSAFATTAFNTTSANSVVTLRVSPDGKNVYVSGPGGLQVFQRNNIDGSLTATQSLAYQLSDMKFSGDARVYAVEPSTNNLFVFNRATNGALSQSGAYNTRLDRPRSVEIGNAVDGQNAVVGRFLYVASAGNSSISVFDEIAADGSDVQINGTLHFLQIVREGVNGVRGLGGVSALQLSAAVSDTALRFGAGELIATSHTVTIPASHGLAMEQAVWFNSPAEAPAGISKFGSNNLYFVRKLDKNSFQLFATSTAARSNDVTQLVAITTGAGTYVMHTKLPAGAFLYALGTDSSTVVSLARDLDTASPTVGQLTFLQVIRNQVGNATGGSNDGLFRPNSIVAPTGDPSSVFVGSSFDDLVDGAPGGFVTFHNNASDSPSLPPIETRIAFTNIGKLTIATGDGADNVTVHQAPTNGISSASSAGSSSQSGGAGAEAGAAAGAAASIAIPLIVTTGAGKDSLTLNDAGDHVMTRADLGSGDDTFTIRSKRTNSDKATIEVQAGDGSDSVRVQQVAANTTLTIWTAGTTDNSNDDVNDVTHVAAFQLSGSSAVKLNTGSRNKDTVLYEVGSAPENGNFVTPRAGELQLDWRDESSPYGSVLMSVGSTNKLPLDSQFINSDFAPLASIVTPDAIVQGGSVTLSSNSSIPDVTPGANQTITVMYAWDLNRDGLFTELVSSNPSSVLTWDDLIDFGYDTKGGGDFRVPLRVTRTFSTFDPAIDQVPRVTNVQQSDSEVTVTVTDTPPVVVINNANANFTVRLGGVPFALDLSRAGDPTNDQVVRWTVGWENGAASEIFDAQQSVNHFYQRPGNYEVTVTGLDENNRQSPSVKTQIHVSFDAQSLSPGAAYIINEGQEIALQGAAAGAPDSLRWFVNGLDAGAGVSQPYNSQSQSVTNALTLTWTSLKQLGVTNEGDFDVQLKATYAGTTAPIASNVIKLTVQNVAPSAVFYSSNSGPINQGDLVTIGFRDVVEPNDALTYSYDFGAGFVTGGVNQQLPASLLPGSHLIKGRLFDGAASTDYQMTIVVNDLSPQISSNAGDPITVIAQEGDLVTRRGTFTNPGGGPVTLTANIGTVSQAAIAHTWTWTYPTADNLPAGQSIVITIKDAEGSTGQVSFGLLVENVAPRIAESDFVVPAISIEGTPITISIRNVVDPSSADTAAGFSYSYDFGDGRGFVLGNATQAVPSSLTANNGELTIRARVGDKDGGTTELSKSLSIANSVATIKTLVITPTQIGSIGPITVTGTFAGDSGLDDTHTVEINWGDGYTDRISGSPAIGAPQRVIGITDRGSGYTDTAGAQVTGGSGTGMTVNIGTLSGAVIEAIISSPGTGYKPGDVLTVKRGAAAGNARVTLGAFSETAGTFTAVHVYAYGTGKLWNPTLIRVTVSDNDGGQDARTLPLVVVGAPNITSLSTVTVDDKQTAVMDVQAIDPGGDTEGNGLTYSLSGGADQSKFSIVAATGVLTFKVAPDANTPADVGNDNIYNVQVTVTNRIALTDVLDVAVTVVPANSAGALDFGDAPASYPVTLAQDGARHKIGPLFLGTGVSAEADGVPGSTASSDSGDDGVVAIVSPFASQGVATRSSFLVTASNAGKLDGWIDFNQDGDWSDVGEQIFRNVAVIAGGNILSYTTPAGAKIGDSAARFRLSTLGSLAPTGAAADGEVEDYLVKVVDSGSNAGIDIQVVNGSIVLTRDNLDNVVRSGGVELFRAPASLVRSMHVNGTPADDTVTIDFASGFVLPTGGVQIAGLAGSNTLAVLGDGTIDFNDLLVNVTDIHHIKLPADTDARLNLVKLDAAAIARLAPTQKSVSINTGINDQIVVKDVSKWLLTDPIVIGGEFMLVAHQPNAGSETIQVSSARPFKNFLQSGDVNNDGKVTALDALLVINELSRQQYSDATGKLVDPLGLLLWPGRYYDVNGNGSISALDALRVINSLGRQSNAETAVEPEAWKSSSITLAARLNTRSLTVDTTNSSDPVTTGDGTPSIAAWLTNPLNRRPNSSITVAEPSAEPINDGKRIDTALDVVDGLLSNQEFLDELRLTPVVDF